MEKAISLQEKVISHQERVKKLLSMGPSQHQVGNEHFLCFVSSLFLVQYLLNCITND